MRLGILAGGEVYNARASAGSHEDRDETITLMRLKASLAAAEVIGFLYSHVLPCWQFQITGFNILLDQFRHKMHRALAS